MGYFSNGTEQMMYDEQYCSNCINQGEDGGCPIMDLHFLYGYELCNEKEHIGKKMLDHLIPMTEDGLWCDECSMFKKKSVSDLQLRLPLV